MLLNILCVIEKYEDDLIPVVILIKLFFFVSVCPASTAPFPGGGGGHLSLSFSSIRLIFPHSRCGLERREQ